MLQFSVGSSPWHVQLFDSYVIHDRAPGRCLGLCDSDRNWIGISKLKPFEDRMKIFWHELAHAWITEFHPIPRNERPHVFTEETTCNLVAMGQSLLNMEDLLRIKAYLQMGVKPSGLLTYRLLPIFEFSQK